MVKCTGRGLVVKRAGVLSKVQMLNLVLGVGVFSLLPISLRGFRKVQDCPPFSGGIAPQNSPVTQVSASLLAGGLYAQQTCSHLRRGNSGALSHRKREPLYLLLNESSSKVVWLSHAVALGVFLRNSLNPCT